MDELLQAALQLKQQLETAQAQLNERINASFKGKSIAAISCELQEDSNSVLEYLIEIGTASEHYEICEAATRLLSERINTGNT